MASAFWRIVGKIIAFALLAAASNAQAGFIGRDVTFELRWPGAQGNVYGSLSANIEDGTWLGLVFYDNGSATFTDNSIRFADHYCCQWSDDIFYVIRGQDLGIANVTLNAARTRQPGLDAGDITFDSDHIYIDVGELVLRPDYYFELDVEFARAIPEPGSLALLGIAMLSLSAARRRG